jgi:1-deoxy-D-xylulose-5-phosphate synthase
VVELTIALHRVFDSPADRILWDTGHQAYVHKILTGRAAGFSRLRQRDGLSGYPSRAESEHDVVENSHASTVLSYADGLAKGHQLRGEVGRCVVAVVGDGALTGGMCWEALNTIASATDRPVVIVVNDNERSYAPTVGALAARLSAIRTTPRPDGTVAPRAVFEDLGLAYLGPVDGHDLAAVERALHQAKTLGGPVLVHCRTVKGYGHPPAEADERDRLHAVRGTAGGSAAVPSGPNWTGVFSDALVEFAAERPELVAITAAMAEPTGLSALQDEAADRVFDVGIAEQHAVASAAGLALAGLHPVVCLCAAFLNRAFDQVLMDAALHGCGMTIVLDRAGVTGEDGPSHNGMWDLSILQVVPGLEIAAPRDAGTLRRALRRAVAVTDGPTVLRFPKGTVGQDIPAVATLGGIDVLRRPRAQDVLLVAVGAMAGACVAAADQLARRDIGVTVVDPVWVKPVDPGLVALAARHRLVVTVEDGCRVGGVGSAVAQAIGDAGLPVPVRNLGLPARFLAQGTREQVLAACGLTARQIGADVGAAVDRAGRDARGPLRLRLVPTPLPVPGNTLDGSRAGGTASALARAASAGVVSATARAAQCAAALIDGRMPRAPAMRSGA